MTVRLTFTITVDDDEAGYILDSIDREFDQTMVHEAYFARHPEFPEFFLFDNVERLD